MLFVAEAVTLCHVARPLVLAHSLLGCGYDVHLACDPRHFKLANEISWTNRHALASQSSHRTARRVWLGQPMFTSAKLRRYVCEDLTLIDRVQPDLIVADMRQSLSASARIRGVPYFTVTNANWSPFAERPFLVPDSILNRIVGRRVAEQVLRHLGQRVFSAHAWSHNRMRRRFGLPPITPDLPHVYTDADHVLYADAPGFVSTREQPANHHFIGPVLWSYPAPLPDWWNRLPTNRPVVFLALGSSGIARLIPRLLRALAPLPVSVICSTLGRIRLQQLPANAFAADFLPMEAAIRRSNLLISHGGSASSYVALAAGVPVLALPSNIDQHLTAHYLCEAGAGLSLRGEQVTVGNARKAAAQLLANPHFTESAQRVARHFADWRMEQTFPELIQRLYFPERLAKSA